MAQLTEQAHIRNMLEAINDRNIPGPGDFNPPEDPPDPMDEPIVSSLVDSLAEMAAKLQKMRKQAETDPKAAYKAYKENLDDMMAAFPADVDAGAEQKSYDLNYNEAVEEYEHLDDLPIKNPQELRQRLKDAKECFDLLGVIVANHAEAIASGTMPDEMDMIDTDPDY